MKLGIFYSHPRIEEKALFSAAEKTNGVELIKIKDSELELDLYKKSVFLECDVILLRSVSHTKNFYAARFLESRKKVAVNSFSTISTCGDKFLTSIILAEKAIPTPRTKVCFDSETALNTIEKWGYPVVMKPVIGSWGRLLSKINDRDAAETIIEHKKILGGITHANAFYIQEYIEKKQSRDIRAIVIGNKVVAAIFRKSEHWITNTARGSDTEPFPITQEFEKIVLSASAAVSDTSALLGVDLVETEEGLKVVEINSGVEFHGLMKTTDIDIPAKIIDFCKNCKPSF